MGYQGEGELGKALEGADVVINYNPCWCAQKAWNDLWWSFQHQCWHCEVTVCCYCQVLSHCECLCSSLSIVSGGRVEIAWWFYISFYYRGQNNLLLVVHNIWFFCRGQCTCCRWPCRHYYSATVIALDSYVLGVSFIRMYLDFL